MDGLAVMRVTMVVVGLMYLLRWAGTPERWAPLLVATLSALGVALWAYTQAPLSQAVVFSYVSGWVAVATSAATVWGFTWAATGRAGRARARRHGRAGGGPCRAAASGPEQSHAERAAQGAGRLVAGGPGRTGPHGTPCSA